jgi:hypothetical protein
MKLKQNKMENRILHIPAQVRGGEFAEDQREFDFVITTDQVDSFRTVFAPEGWDFTRYQQNPVVFYNHRSGGDDPDDLVGITVKGPYQEKMEDGSTAFVARVRLEPEDVNPKAEKIRKKIINGSIRMASIGAAVYDAEYRDGEDDERILTFTRQELFEWSIVNVGSNPGAIMKSNEKVLQEIRSAIPGIQPGGSDQEPENENRANDVQLARLEIAKSKSKFK